MSITLHFARALPVLGAIVLALPATAQTALHTIHGAFPSEGLYTTASFAGDVNGDGIVDWIVGVRTDDTAGSNEGIARVHSGADGSIVHTLFGINQFSQAPPVYFGTSVSGVGDVNADGFDDVIVGATGAPISGAGNVGNAQVFSGLDGALLFTLEGDSSADRFGRSVSGAGDVNGDGIPDFVVGAPGNDLTGNDNRGSVHIFSGADGSLLHTMFGGAIDGLGTCVDGAGDVNGDGFDDVVVSALAISDPNANGEVFVISGATGALLHTFAAATPFEWFGVSCAGAGDVDADGRGDIIVGIKHASTAGWHAGAAKVYSGATGAVLYTFDDTSVADAFGESVDGAGDVNGDGFDDLIVGSVRDHLGISGMGSATVFSGIDGGVLFTVYGGHFNDELGAVVAGNGDVDLDGRSEVIVLTSGSDVNGSNSGTVRVLSLASAACTDVTSYCSGLPNSTGVGAFLHFTGTTSVGANDLRIHVADGPPTQPGLFFFGSLAASSPFGNGLRCVAGFVRRLTATIIDNSGNATHVLDSTSVEVGGAITVGSNWNFQFYYRDPGVGAGFNATDALSIVFCP